MASVSDGNKNKDGSWSFYIRVYTGIDSTGKKMYSRHTFKGESSWSKETTRKKALSYAALLDQRVTEGISPGTNIRFRDYAKEVIATKESMGMIKHSTANRYRDSLKKVDGYIGNQKLSAIRPDKRGDTLKQLVHNYPPPSIIFWLSSTDFTTGPFGPYQKPHNH